MYLPLTHYPKALLSREFPLSPRSGIYQYTGTDQAGTSLLGKKHAENKVSNLVSNLVIFFYDLARTQY